MKRTIDNTIVAEIKVEINSPELKSDYEFDLLGEERYDAAWEEDCVETIGLQVEQYPFSIEKLRKILDDLEQNGCNYVSIDYHCDHEEYNFYGVNLHVATQVEIDEEDEKQKQKELREIQDALAKLERDKERILKMLAKKS